MKLVSLLLFLCVFLSGAAHAQSRIFPSDAPRGYLSPPPRGGGNMLLNDKPVPLTTGAQIRDESNIIVSPHMVRPDSIVKYKLEYGGLHRAWILTPQEIKSPDTYKLPTKVKPAND
ncbi:MAG TPA: hypothetical protein VJM53_01825 [Burkholderiales bacterium]|nr:hypothetical protein [Burkholderiales bacterium]